MLENDTIRDDRIRRETSVWLPLAADTEIALASLAGIERGLSVRVAEVTPDGVRIAVIAEPVAAPERASREADLRAAGLRALRKAGLLS